MDGIPDEPLTVRHDVSAAAARGVVRAIVAEAAREGHAVSVAVVDSAGVLVAAERMDGALRFSAGLAVAKARTAASFGRPTSAMEAVMADRPVFAQSFTAQGDWYLGRGGFPLTAGGVPVGGVGVSGDAAEYEEELARAAAGAFSASAERAERPPADAD